MAPNLAKYSILLSVLFTFSLSATTARDTITPTQPLADDETLVSSGGTFALGFFTPSDNPERRYVGIWFNNSDTSPTIVWVANRENPVNGTGQLSVTANGTMMITDRDSTVVWSAGTAEPGLTNQVAVLLDTGNLVLMKQDRGDISTDHQNYTWQGFDYPTDTLLPGMELGTARKIGNLNRTMTAWRSAEDPSLGDYFASMGTGRNPELYLFKGSVKVWRSGPWNGVQLSGIPVVGGVTNYSFVSNDKEATFSYQVSSSEQPIPPILKINQSAGTIQWLAWSRNTGQWDIINWDAPVNQCDRIGTCGPYAICDSTKKPVCNCLEGFKQMDPSNWTNGCVREVALADCGDGTDVFVPVKGVKLPETTSSSLVNTTSSPDACKFECLKNCDCTGYAISAGGGENCTIWVTELLDVVQLFNVEQDLNVRLAANYWDSHSQKTKRKIVAIVASLLSGTLLLSCVIAFLWRRKKSGWVILDRNIFFGDKLDEYERRKDLDLPLFNFGTIAAATESFSDRNKLGQGGFGPVYKGMLGGDKEIAVKRLAKSSQQGTEEFKNEVMLIAKLQNRNLVRLLGCCI